MPQNVLQIHPDDNLLVALADLPQSATISFNGYTITLRQPVPAKHKFTITPIPEDGAATLYGVTVGRVTQPLLPGAMITTQNLLHHTDKPTITDQNPVWTPPDVSQFTDRTFDGYHRSDGRVGLANHWIFIPLVFCENHNLHTLREALLEQLGYTQKQTWRTMTNRMIEAVKNGDSARQIIDMQFTPESTLTSQKRLFPNIDGLKFLTHSIGCGGTREDAANLCKLFAGYINHPNVAGATVLSLGCQNAEVSAMTDALHDLNPRFDKPLYIFEQQKVGAESALIEKSLRHTMAGLIEANQITRQPAPLHHLRMGVECGGSDGFSGISANPAIGHAADMLVALGGAVILGEFPELAGTEQEIIDRCVDRLSAEKFLSIMDAYEARALAVGSGFDQNPSPGNIADGLITDAIKSAGAVRKGGSSPITDVLDYTEPSTRPGLNLLCTPGGDVESTTALVGSGANIICFSTGMGTPTGNAVAPVLKIATNSDVAVRMPDVIDIDAGPIIHGTSTIPQIAHQILESTISAASGRYIPKAVALGQDDFIPWKRGVSL